jgi:beta-lactamase regulating signal transducer with metallopeptidase domain
VRYYLLALSLGLAAFTMPALLASIGVSIGWPRLRPRIEGRPARSCARFLFGLRALPTIIGGVSVAALTSAFVRHEPRETIEQPGAMLVAAAAAAVILAGLIAVRGLREARRAWTFGRLARHCRHLRRGSGESVCVVESRYPVAAVVGLFRPRLLISSRILCDCGAEALDVIVAHEQAHIRNRHNVARALMLALPDPLAVMQTGRDLEAAWALAAEETADDEAAGVDEARRTILASALLHVARLADERPPAWMPALAFYQGHGLEHRVRSLLAAPRPERSGSGALSVSVAALAVVVLALTDRSSDSLHRALEWMVRSLP